MSNSDYAVSIVLEDRKSGDIIRKLEYVEFLKHKNSEIEIIKTLSGKELFESLFKLNHIVNRKGKMQFNYFDPFPEDKNKSASILTGRIAEIAILNSCTDKEMNREYGKIARIGKNKSKSLDKFRPIITKDLKNRLNLNDSQIDIFWLKENTDLELLLQINSSSNSGSYAGLQVKFSTDGISYVLPSLKSIRYSVPLVYFGFNNDYEKIRDKLFKALERDSEFKKKKHISDYIDSYFINMKAFDIETYEKVYNFYPMVQKLINGNMKIDDLMDSKKMFREAVSETMLQDKTIRKLII